MAIYETCELYYSQMHLYVHIPFCHEICPYCSFYKHKPGNLANEEFVTALLKELDWHLKQHPSLSFTTIYIGGGTPSLLSSKLLTQLLVGLNSLIPFAQCTEITLEANPSTFKLPKAQLIKSLGVTRISLGIQSLDPEQHTTLGRDHTPEEAIASYHLLREAELPHVNIDLMFSTPGQTLDSWRTTLEQAISLRPDHISCYNLTYEEDTAYFQKFLTGDYTDEPEKNENLFYTADELLTKSGYLHYETSNYAQPGAESIHNQGYWSGNDYLGIGPSAVGCLNRRRYQNLADTAGYIQRINTVSNAIDSHEDLDDEAWRLERLALELRTTTGCPAQYLGDSDPSPLIEHGLIHPIQERIKTTPKGASLVDSIVEYLA